MTKSMLHQALNAMTLQMAVSVSLYGLVIRLFGIDQGWWLLWLTLDGRAP